MFLNFDDKEERDRLPPFKTVTSYDERAGLRYEEYFEQFVLYPYFVEDEITLDDYPDQEAKRTYYREEI